MLYIYSMMRTIRFKTVFSVSLLLGSAFIILAFLNFSNSREAVREELVKSSIPLIRDNTYADIRNHFATALNVSSVMCHDTFLIDWITEGEKDLNKIINYLNSIQNEYGYFSVFFVSNITKKYYHYNGLHKIVNKEDDHDIWFYNFVNSGRHYEVDVDNDEAGENQLTIFINYRVENSLGECLGVTGVGIQLSNFSQYLKLQQEQYNRTIFLTDSRGIVKAHHNLDAVGRVHIQEKEHYRAIAEELLLPGAGTVLKSRDSQGNHYYIASRYIEEMGWFLIVEFSERTALNTAQRNFFRTLLTGLLILLLFIISTLGVINHYNKQLETMAVSDPLTNAINRREFSRQLEQYLYKRTRYGTSVTLIMMDVDFFKKINDSYGHQSGDLVLIELVKRVESIKRPDDILCRLGGDEFVVLMEAGSDAAFRLAERIQDVFSRIPVVTKGGDEITVSLSMGIYEVMADEACTEILSRADQILYMAKSSGRSCIQME